MSEARELFTEVDLQALLDGELSQEEQAAVTTWLESSPAAQRQLEVLRAVHAAMAEFARVPTGGTLAAPMAEPVQASGTAAEVDVEGSGVRRRARRGGGLWDWRTVLAAAAAVVVGVIFLMRPRPDDASPAQGNDSAENELCRLQVVPLHGGSWPIYSAIAFELQWQGKGHKPLCVLAGDSEVATTAAAAEARGEVPLRLEVLLHTPAGRELLGSVRAPSFVVPSAAAAPKSAVQTLELWQVAVPDQRLAPIFGVGVEGVRWRLDPNWCLLHFARELPPGERWFVPEEAGEYQVEVRAVRAGSPAIGAALAVSTSFRVEAEASGWSAPRDGLRARIVAVRSQFKAGQPTALALQLRNESGRMRQYNVVGLTMAPIPQPYHFDLVVDGVVWQQDKGRTISFSSAWMFAEQPDRTLRSIVVLPEQWRHEGRRLDDLPGEHELQFRFHFVPTLWSGGDSLWQGEVTTPALKVTVGKAK